MADEMEFMASGDACEICQALDGTNCAELPHENCMCQIVPKQSGDCTINYTFQGGGYDGPTQYDGFVDGEITVTCADGSEIGESFQLDLHPYRGSGKDSFDLAVDAFEAEGEALCDECPEPEPFRCC